MLAGQTLLPPRHLPIRPSLPPFFWRFLHIAVRHTLSFFLSKLPSNSQSFSFPSAGMHQVSWRWIREHSGAGHSRDSFCELQDWHIFLFLLIQYLYFLWAAFHLKPIYIFLHMHCFLKTLQYLLCPWDTEPLEEGHSWCRLFIILLFPIMKF